MLVVAAEGAGIDESATDCGAGEPDPDVFGTGCKVRGTVPAVSLTGTGTEETEVDASATGTDAGGRSQSVEKR